MNLLQANYERENSLQEEENKELKEKMAQLEKEMKIKDAIIKGQLERIAQKEEKMDQLLMDNGELLDRIAKHQKAGIPYYNRTIECLSVPLKLPQFTCVTLQPLIEAHPEIGIIIAKKAKEGFYKSMIELQNELMMIHHI